MGPPFQTYASVDQHEQLETHNMVHNAIQQDEAFQGVDILVFTPTANNTAVNNPLKHRGQHTPTDIKTFVKTLQGIDPQFKILPFEAPPNTRQQDTDVITNEDDLPDRQD